METISLRIWSAFTSERSSRLRMSDAPHEVKGGGYHCNYYGRNCNDPHPPRIKLGDIDGLL